MEKRLQQVFTLFILILLGGAALPGCKHQITEPDDSLTNAPLEQDTYVTAIDDYLVEVIGTQYSPGEVCIPCYTIVDIDKSDTTDIRVWGDFWVFNYNISGDTLKTVSGGSHPGLMHICKDNSGYTVTSFDQVEDGAGNTSSAQRIFGSRYDAFHTINSNAIQRDSCRTGFVAQYSKHLGLSVTMYQDFGWPPVALPTE